MFFIYKVYLIVVFVSVVNIMLFHTSFSVKIRNLLQKIVIVYVFFSTKKIYSQYFFPQVAKKRQVLFCFLFFSVPDKHICFLSQRHNLFLYGIINNYLKRLKNRLRTRQGDERLDALLRIYIEKDIVKELMNSDKKLEDLVYEYGKKNRKLDFGFVYNKK